MVLDAGWSADLSGPVATRAVCHADNAYFLPAADIAAYCARTNRQSNTAFRGFGGPQGALAIERILDDIAYATRRDPLDVRKRNFYGEAGRDVTPYHQTVEDQILPRITSNVSIMDSEPDADPLGEWLDSIAKFRRKLPGDMLVLPAHGSPFRGVQVRLDKLAEGHHDRLDKLEIALREKPMRAVDTFALLFDRPIDESVFGLAAGESHAHLVHLVATGRAKVETIDGVGWYSAV